MPVITKVEPLKENSKLGWFFIERKKVRYWVDSLASYPVKIEEGTDVPDDQMEEKEKGGYLEWWLKAPPKPAVGRGGNGGRGYVPKSPEEIHAGPLSSVIAAALVYAASPNATRPEGVSESDYLAKLMAIATKGYNAGQKFMKGDAKP